MSADHRKDLVRRYYDEAWNRGHLAVLDELFSPDYVAPLPHSPTGPEGEKQHLAMLRGIFPDLRLAVDELVAEADTIAARWTMTATESGGFLGRPPTGRQVTYWGVDFFRFSGDLISSVWVGVDMLGLMIQLGVVPSPWPIGEQSAAQDS